MYIASVTVVVVVVVVAMPRLLIAFVVFSLILDRCLSAVSSRLLVVVYLFIFNEEPVTLAGVWRHTHTHTHNIYTDMYTYKCIFDGGNVWKYTYGRKSIVFTASKSNTHTHSHYHTHLHLEIYVHTCVCIYFTVMFIFIVIAMQLCTHNNKYNYEA